MPTFYFITYTCLSYTSNLNYFIKCTYYTKYTSPLLDIYCLYIHLCVYATPANRIALFTLYLSRVCFDPDSLQYIMHFISNIIILNNSYESAAINENNK